MTVKWDSRLQGDKNSSENNRKFTRQQVWGTRTVGLEDSSMIVKLPPPFWGALSCLLWSLQQNSAQEMGANAQETLTHHFLSNACILSTFCTFFHLLSIFCLLSVLSRAAECRPSAGRSSRNGSTEGYVKGPRYCTITN